MRIYKSLLILIISAFLVSGCQTLRDKFRRKPKGKEVKIVVDIEEYEPGYTPKQRYISYFAFWKAWHSDLLSSLESDGNRKKQIQAASAAIKNLRSIQDMLVQAKAEELEARIKELKEIEQELKSRRISITRSRSLIRQAEKVKRKIEKEFYFRKVESYLKVDRQQ